MFNLSEWLVYRSKQPEEIIPIPLNLKRNMEDEETLTDFTVTATNVATGADVTSTFIDIATKNINGSQISVFVQGGSDGEKYELIFLVETSLSPKRWQINVIVTVKEMKLRKV